MLLIPIMLLAFNACNRPAMDPVEPSVIATPTLLKEVLGMPVDIRPFATGNVINPATRSAVSVAIPGSEAFDVTTVDPSSARFCPGLTAPAHAFTVDSPTDHVRDINEDGFVDLMSHLDTRVAEFQPEPARTT